MTKEPQTLNPEEIVRYSRHLLLPEVGVAGQKKLKNAKALIVGLGGLGSPVALYLAAAGVGALGLVDFDRVELSNLQRQIIHGSNDLSRFKTDSAKERLLTINPNITVKTYPVLLNKDNAMEILQDYDLILDGSDNFPARYLLNDAAFFLGRPLIYGSIYRFEGQASVFWGQKGPCYRCLYPTPPSPGLAPSCGEAGVMGVLPGLIGAIQATEAIKLILGGGKTLIGRLMLVDAFTMEFTDLELEKDPNCPLCGPNPTIRELIDYEVFCGQNVPPELMAEGLSPLELKNRLSKGPPLQIVDIREDQERELFSFPGAIAMNFLDLEKRLSELDPTVDAIIICKIGQRSLFAIRKLKKAGYEGRLFNLKGGSNAWARDVDPTKLIY
ncbi:MAG: molybdopterin-synthase adenylyltransferase MoeB [Deltaproteobacteria bacterium]|nr:molybdopterin-synthase adenylyltransferase MoeB [Deltaproteobacteria bacterium]